MAGPSGDWGSESITRSEHIGPTFSGDNIDAKKVVNYDWDSTTSSWVRRAAGLVPGSYDYISYANTSSTVDTYVFKTGGSGGTTVATVTITYTDSTKNQISTVART